MPLTIKVIRIDSIECLIKKLLFLGNDALLVCSLTCLQRVLENYGKYMSQYFTSIFVSFAQICCVVDCRPSLVSYHIKRI